MFSRQDIEKVQRIRGLMDDLGVNLAGVEVILKLLHRLQASEADIRCLQAESERLHGLLEARR